MTFMEGQLLQLPHSLTEWVLAIGVLVMGGFNVFNYFFKNNKQAEKDADETSDRVIKLLKDQVDALEKKVMEQEIILRDTNTKLESLITENRTLRDVLQGRDDMTKAYQDEARKTFAVADKVLSVVLNTDQKVDKLVARVVTDVVSDNTSRINQLEKANKQKK